MKILSKKAYAADTVTKTIIIFISVFAAAALVLVLLSAVFPKKTQEQKQFDLLKEEFCANVTLPKEDWYYSYSMSDFDNSEEVKLFLTTDEHFKSADFYIMLCTIKNIEEYLKTRDDCKDKSLKIGFEEWRAGKVWEFDMTFAPDGNVGFYYDWTYNADLTKLAEVFPDTNEVEFSYQYSDYGENHIEELSGLSELKKLKFTFDVNKAEECEAHIGKVFQNCELDIKRVGYIPTEEQQNYDNLKKELSENITLPNKDWEYSYTLTDLDKSKNASVYVKADYLNVGEFYDMLCTLKDIGEYLKNRDDFKGKAIETGFEEYTNSRFWTFSVTFQPDGNVGFYYNWSSYADLNEIARVFPEINSVEFSYDFTDFGVSHIDELSGLSKLESVKFTVGYEQDFKEEQKARIKEIFPDCDVDIECIGIYG